MEHSEAFLIDRIQRCSDMIKACTELKEILLRDLQKHDEGKEINRCISCHENIGANNPRQYCAKTRCRKEYFYITKLDKLLEDYQNKDMTQ